VISTNGSIPKLKMFCFIKKMVISEGADVDLVLNRKHIMQGVRQVFGEGKKPLLEI
jgi:hypothetical protein